jgi:hypothetical protein
VREDTHDYIAVAVTKLFQHDTGDFHELRQNFRKLRHDVAGWPLHTTLSF